MIIVFAVASGLGFLSYPTFVIQTIALYAIAAYGLDIAAGYAGVLSLGHGAAFAVGGYAVAIFSATHGQPFWITLPLSMVAGALLGILMGAPATRLGGLGLAMISLGFALIAGDVALSAATYTGGQQGIVGVVPTWGFGLQSAALDSTGVLVLILVCLLLTYVVHAAYRVSHLGRAAFAVKDEPLGARALGIAVGRTQITAVSAASAFGGLAGGLYVYMNQLVSPDIAALSLSFLFLIMVVFGGAGNQYGPLIGAAVIGSLPIFLSKYTSINNYIYAAMLLVVVLLRPRGIVGRTGKLARLPQVRSQPREDGPAHRAGGRDSFTLRCADLSRSFGGVRALHEVSLTVAEGEVVAIVGPNGSGKTTLLNVLSGYYPPSAGNVFLGGDNISAAGVTAIARAGVGRTFQTPKIFGSLSPSEHIALALSQAHGRPGGAGDAELRISYDLLDAAGLALHGDHRESRDLSHGQRRFLELAMAIARRPVVLLLDEPATGLSAEEGDILADTIRAVTREGVGVLVVEHHMEIVREIADRAHVLHLGQTLWTGPAHAMGDSELVRNAYLGR
ncbi:MAG TPA: ATP-binding cassette domain-containing protein [Amycolatopsis sp.]|nr:ATP-binding cassette domain-containing protein [Amycolatopsis sp.]